jgi:hypothetical protein
MEKEKKKRELIKPAVSFQFEKKNGRRVSMVQGRGGCCGGRALRPNGPPEILLDGTSFLKVFELDEDPERDREFTAISSCWKVPTLGEGGRAPLLLLLPPSRCSGGTGF